MDPQVEWRTGDIILFSGSGINSLVIRLFTNSVWSHVGVVCWIELLYHNGKREVELFSFELGSKAYEDLMTGQDAQLKVRLVRLQTILKMYDMVAIRKLKLPSRTPKQSRAWSKKFQKYAWKMRGKPFHSFSTMLNNHFIEAGADEGETTCAQTTGELLKHLGVFDIDFDLSQLNPQDFASGKRTFGKEIFASREKIIYLDNKNIVRRFLKIMIVMIVVILLLIILLIYGLKRRASRKKAKKAASTSEQSTTAG